MIGPIAAISARNTMNNAFSSICRNNDEMYSSLSSASPLAPLSADTVSFSSNLRDCENLQNSVKYQVASANYDAMKKFTSDKIKRSTIHLVA